MTLTEFLAIVWWLFVLNVLASVVMMAAFVLAGVLRYIADPSTFKLFSEKHPDANRNPRTGRDQ